MKGEIKMGEQRAIVMRSYGDNDMSEQISEGMWKAEALKLKTENEALRKRVREMEDRARLFLWGMEREREGRLEAECALDKKKRALWRRAFRLLGCEV